MRNPFKRKIIVLRPAHKLRPATGKCPGCKAKEREFCRSVCDFVDGFNPADR